MVLITKYTNPKPTNPQPHTVDSQSLPQKGFGNSGQGETRNPHSPTVDSDDLLGFETVLEFQKSAIPDWYVPIAFDTAQTPDELAEILRGDFEWTGRMGSSTRIEMMTAHDARRYYYWDKYTKDGGWVAIQASLSGLEDNPAYLKLYNPRTDFKTGKFVKYETPAKSEARPLLPPFTWEMGLAVVRKHCQNQVQTAYLKRFKVSEAALTDIDFGFWDFVEANSEIPIVLAEGWKKGCALAVRGYPAVVLRGVRCFFRSKTKFEIPTPHAVNDRLFCKRKVTFAFDQDEKESTQKDVAKALATIAKWLEKRKCKVNVASWDNQLGKGVDDVLFGMESADEWLDQTICGATPYRQWTRGFRTQKAFEVIKSLNTLSYAVERATTGEYLPQLPTLSPGGIHVLSATMNSGKTVRIGADWVKSAVGANWRVLVLGPLNSLGQQTAQDWDLPHIHDYELDKDSQKALWSDVSSRNGIVMCYDSLHRLPGWFFKRNDQPCPVLLVLDEANQGVSHLTVGATLKGRWADIRERFTSVAAHAIRHGAIVLSEDGLPDRAVDFVRRVVAAGTDLQIPIRAFTHKKDLAPWDCTFWNGDPSGFRADLLAAIATQKKPIFYVTTSKAEGRKLERRVSRQFPQKEVVRIDSDTNQKGEFREFFSTPDSWLQDERPDLLILTPSGRTGLSIEGGISVDNAYFGSVWGHFSVLDTDSALQLLGRYRPPVPRNIYCPAFIQTSSDEKIGASWAIVARWKANAECLARMLEDGTEDTKKTIRELEIDDATLEFLSKSIAVSGAQKTIAQDALVDRLTASGHRISIVKSTYSREVAAEWKTIEDELAREDAVLAAMLSIDPSKHTKDWAIETLSSNDATRESRVRAQKVLWRDEFPGVNFDSIEECYQAIYRDYGRMRSGVKAQAQAENPTQTKLMDAGKLAATLKDGKLHDLPKSAAKAVLMNALGVLNLLDGESYSNDDSRCVAVKEKALKYAADVQYWLNLYVNEDQTPVEICHKLLRRFGFEIDKEDRPGAIEVVGRPGKRSDSRDRTYRINLDYNPVRTKLLEAYRRKLSESVSISVSMISNTPNTDIEIVDTNPQNPLNEELAGLAEMLDTFSADGILDRDAMRDLTSHLNPSQKRQVWEWLPPETRNRLKAIAS
jgi:Domain of unknown function (DUF3854)